MYDKIHYNIKKKKKENIMVLVLEQTTRLVKENKTDPNTHGNLVYERSSVSDY